MNKIIETILCAGFGMSVSLLIGIVAYVAVYAIFKSLAKNGVTKNLKLMTVFCNCYIVASFLIYQIVSFWDYSGREYKIPLNQFDLYFFINAFVIWIIIFALKGAKEGLNKK